MTASPQQRSTRRTILVVDDDEDVRGLLRAMIERAAHRVLEAAGGAEALELIGRARPDLILLDVHMPGLDGTEVCRRIKAEPATPAIPVLMLTAAVRAEDRHRALSGGADGYITKPFSPRSLLDQIGVHLGTG
jgi:CheY-like chemotaxis protein